MPTLSLSASDITVMFRPAPWKIGPSGYSAVTSAPQLYSVFVGPATLEMMALRIVVLISGVCDSRPSSHEYPAREMLCARSISRVGPSDPLCSLACGVRFGDRQQPVHRIGDVGVQVAEHARELVAARPVGLSVHRRRDDRDQRFVR